MRGVPARRLSRGRTSDAAAATTAAAVAAAAVAASIAHGRGVRGAVSALAPRAARRRVRRAGARREREPRRLIEGVVAARVGVAGLLPHAGSGT